MTTLREAAQQALEALEEAMNYTSSPTWSPSMTEECEAAAAALLAALAEPVQEPVAWQWLDTAHFRKKIPASATPAHWRPLYTAPPQRKPLTEEEIIDLWAGVSDPESPDISMIDFARAIERAHGIG